MTRFTIPSLVLAVVASTASAQSLPAQSGPRAGPVAFESRLPRAGANASDRRVPDAAGEKSAGTAVALSVLVPGAGSFYAGNSGHGWAHLVVHLVGYGMVVGGTTTCVTATGADCTEVSGVATAGAVAVIGNWIWGMVTANRDAKAFNARQAP